jgi:hypothetical protein
MADSGVNSLIDGFKTLGDLISGIFKNEHALFFVTLAVFLILIYTLIKAVLKKIPFFEGGDNSVNTQGNVVAWCLALLSVISIGWGMKDKGADYMVQAIAGPFGMGLIVGLGIAVFYGTIKTLENTSLKPNAKWGVSLLLTLLITGWFFGHAVEGFVGLWGLILIIIGAGVIVTIMHFWGKKVI